MRYNLCVYVDKQLIPVEYAYFVLSTVTYLSLSTTQ